MSIKPNIMNRSADLEATLPASRVTSRHERADRAFDMCLALLLSPIAILLLVPCFIVHQLCNFGRGSFIYTGIRLGKGKKLFQIYKIRTLVEDAETRLGSRLAADRDHLELRLGRFFRATRIDELPQIFNILKGDMGFVGPRPERVNVYHQKCKVIKDYDMRFKVRPGLVGYAQILTPHSTPKRIRAIIDRRYINKGITPMQKLRLIIWTVLLVFRITVKETYKSIARRVNIVARKRTLRKERRKYPRVKCTKVTADVTSATDLAHSVDGAKVWDLNVEAIKLETNLILNIGDEILLQLNVAAKKGQKRRASCKGTIYRKAHLKFGNEDRRVYIVFYQPQSEYSQYVIDQYLLMQSVSKAG